MASSGVVDDIGGLVANSLLAADLRDETAQYRLLDTTRLYAFNKLRSTAEPPEAARCHAEYYCGLFAHAEAESESRRKPSGWPSTAGISIMCAPVGIGHLLRTATRGSAWR